MATMTQQERASLSHDILYMIPSTKYQFEKDGEKTLLQDHNEDSMASNLNEFNRNETLSKSPALSNPRKHVPIQLYDNPSPALSITDVPSSKRSIHHRFLSRSLSTKKAPLHKSIFHRVKSFFSYSSKN